MERDWYETPLMPPGVGVPYWDVLATDAEAQARPSLSLWCALLSRRPLSPNPRLPSRPLACPRPQALRVHPALGSPTGNCTFIPMAWVADFLLAQRAIPLPADDDEVVEGSSYEEFDAHTDHLHSWVHCWWVANGYGGDGAPCFAPYDAASKGVNLTREVMLRAYAAEKGEQVRPLGPLDSRPAPPPPLVV